MTEQPQMTPNNADSGCEGPAKPVTNGREQRIWTEGYLAGLRSAKQAVRKKALVDREDDTIVLWDDAKYVLDAEISRIVDALEKTQAAPEDGQRSGASPVRPNPEP